MNKLVLTSIALCGILSSFAQKDPVLMTVGDKEVTKSEFEQIFFKNYKKETVEKSDLDEYIDLFVKFKLKVTEAEAREMDKDPKFVSELAGYRKQLVRPYMVDKDMDQALIDEAYERMKNEVRASHIMVKLSENAAPYDTVVAYNKAMNIRNRIIKGEDFVKVAKGKGGSEDPSAQSNGGDLGFFKVFDMVYPFESAVFNMEVGDVSMPVRSRYGYHIIKKTGERPARGDLKVAHILISDDSKSEVKFNAKTKIDEIYKLIQDGGDFAELAKQHSDDRKYGAKGGELPVFGTGKMIPAFEEAAYQLKKDGEYTEPFKTDFGWHIVKRIEYYPLGSKEELLSSIKSKVKRDTRSNKSKKSFLDKLKKEYKFIDNSPKLFPALMKELDTTIFQGVWDGEVQYPNELLASFADKKFTLGDFANYLKEKQRKEREQDLHDYVANKYEFYIESQLTKYEESRLDEKYPEFKALMKEYHEGILLFEITDQEVWSKAQKDSAGLAEFYAKNNKDFMWGDRIHADIYKLSDPKLAKTTRKLVKKKKSLKEITDKINNDSQLNVKAESGKFEVDDETRTYLKSIEKTGVTKVLNIDGSYYVLNVKEILPSQAKLLSETRGPVIAKYQEFLEAKWIKELKAKYPVEVNKDVLYSVKK